MGKTFTEEEIFTAVMQYGSGCAEGKRDFLRSLGVAPVSRRFEVVVIIEVPSHDDEGHENEAHHVTEAINDTLTSYMSNIATCLISSEEFIKIVSVSEA